MSNLVADRWSGLGGAWHSGVSYKQHEVNEAEMVIEMQREVYNNQRPGQSRLWKAFNAQLWKWLTHTRGFEREVLYFFMQLGNWKHFNVIWVMSCDSVGQSPPAHGKKEVIWQRQSIGGECQGWASSLERLALSGGGRCSVYETQGTLVHPQWPLISPCLSFLHHVKWHED